MKQLNVTCSEYADKVIAIMGDLPLFTEKPLLKSALKWSAAWAFEAWRAGRWSVKSIEEYGVHVKMYADRVEGDVDLITTWVAHHGVQSQFQAAASQAFSDLGLTEHLKPSAPAQG